MRERIEAWLQEEKMSYETGPRGFMIKEYVTSRCVATELTVSVLDDRVEILFDWSFSHNKPSPLELPEHAQLKFRAALSLWLWTTPLQFEVVGKNEHGIPLMLQIFYPIYEDGLTKDSFLRGLDQVCRGRQVITGSLLVDLF